MEAVDSAVEIKSNASVLSLTAPDKMRTAKKGRPCVHPFAGRIALLREEVAWALENGDVFIEMMNKAHKFDEERQAQLIAAGVLDPTVTEMFYTFQGPIELVLKEVLAIKDRYQEQVEIGTAALRFDFHKKKTLNDPKMKKKPSAEELALYRPPTMQRIGFDDVCLQIEAFPDQIYGYVKVTLKNEE